MCGFLSRSPDRSPVINSHPGYELKSWYLYGVLIGLRVEMLSVIIGQRPKRQTQPLDLSRHIGEERAMGQYQQAMADA